MVEYFLFSYYRLTAFCIKALLYPDIRYIRVAVQNVLGMQLLFPCQLSNICFGKKGRLETEKTSRVTMYWNRDACQYLVYVCTRMAERPANFSKGLNDNVFQ